MTSNSDLPFVEIDAEYVVGVIAAMFDRLSPDPAHSPESYPCAVCAGWHRMVDEAVRGEGEPMDIVRRLRFTIPANHPTEDCIPCEGCRFEQRHAMDLIEEVYP